MINILGTGFGRTACQQGLSNYIFFDSFHVRDVTGMDGGEGAFSRLHHEMEKVMREGEKIRSKKKLDCNTNKLGS